VKMEVHVKVVLQIKDISVFVFQASLQLIVKKMWMSVCRRHTLAVLTQCAATPMDHITAAVTQITMATDETVHGQVVQKVGRYTTIHVFT